MVATMSADDEKELAKEKAWRAKKEADQTELIRVRQMLRQDFPRYAATCLRIRTKSGTIAPFKMNRAQWVLHKAIEDQIKRTGKVRKLVLKGRQMGISTYVEGRLYHQVTHRVGTNGFILTHRARATQNLFNMVKRFHDLVPNDVKPNTGRRNANELWFPKLDSGYTVATAEASGVGRSDTFQLWHGSEVAYWAQVQQKDGGAFDAVPYEAGTEIILESTANGVGGMFHGMVKQAIAGKIGFPYELVFLPWFIHDEYREPVPPGWLPPEAFLDYQRSHKVRDDQLYWFYLKNSEIAAREALDPYEICWRTRQEYPGTATEAFQSSAHGFIRMELVEAARGNTVSDQSKAPLIIGVDVARGGQDRTRFIDRQGRCAGYNLNLTINSDNEMEIAGLLGIEIDRLNPQMVFIDVTGGGGQGAYDRLVERKYGKVLTPIIFGKKARRLNLYANKRAEMWGDFRDWLNLPGGVDLPADDEQLALDILAPQGKTDSSGRTLLERKEDIKKRLGVDASPDGGDALALTFAEPVSHQGEQRQRSVQARMDPPRRLQGASMADRGRQTRQGQRRMANM